MRIVTPVQRVAQDATAACCVPSIALASVGFDDGAIPSARLRSFGPMNRPSTPSTLAISEAAARAGAVSIMGQRKIAASAAARYIGESTPARNGP